MTSTVEYRGRSVDHGRDRRGPGTCASPSCPPLRGSPAGSRHGHGPLARRSRLPRDRGEAGRLDLDLPQPGRHSRRRPSSPTGRRSRDVLLRRRVRPGRALVPVALPDRFGRERPEPTSTATRRSRGGLALLPESSPCRRASGGARARCPDRRGPAGPGVPGPLALPGAGPPGHRDPAHVRRGDRRGAGPVGGGVGPHARRARPTSAPPTSTSATSPRASTTAVSSGWFGRLSTGTGCSILRSEDFYADERATLTRDASLPRARARRAARAPSLQRHRRRRSRPGTGERAPGPAAPVGRPRSSARRVAASAGREHLGTTRSRRHLRRHRRRRRR